MENTFDPTEARLSQSLAQASTDATLDIQPVLRRARRRVGARNVLTLSLGRIWLALARLLAPLAVRLHRLSQPARHH